MDCFRETHALARPAIYPQAAASSLALVLLAQLYNASGSASPFADIDPVGLIGSAGKAVGLSLANVALGFLARYLGLRDLGHRRLPVRDAGAGALVAGKLGGLGLTLFAAQWRDRAEAHAAAERAQAHPHEAAAANDKCLARAHKLGDGQKAGLDCRTSPGFQECLARRDEAACLCDAAFQECRTAPAKAAQAKAAQANDAARACAQTDADKLSALRKPPVQIAFLPLTTPQALTLPKLDAAVFVSAALKGYCDGHDPDPD